jgi:hypothetical protein
MTSFAPYIIALAIQPQAWRHKDLKIRMFYPMLAYQTFESTSLTDLSRSKPTGLSQKIKELSAVKMLEEWATDPMTHQPWQHVFDEPLLQLGPRGPIITVERQFAVILWGTSLATALRSFGLKRLSNWLFGGTAAFLSTIALLMNWK